MSTGYVHIGHVYGHRDVVEAALGKRLPRGACVHHVDGDKKNNSPSNLMVCQDQSYHSLMHFRAKALAETGSPNSWRCDLCSGWILPGSEDRIGRQGCSRHRTCNAAWFRAKYGWKPRDRSRCRQGHVWTPENTYYGKGGQGRSGRICRLCKHEAYLRKISRNALCEAEKK